MARLKTVEVTETYKVPDLASKVAKGVALLDKHCGPKWPQKVDPKTLDLGDGSSCVVGQLAIKAMLNGPLDGFYDGVKKLFPGLEGKEVLDDQRIVDHGFLVNDELVVQVEEWLEKQPPTHPWWPLAIGKNGSNIDLNNLLYDYLTAIWIQVIKARRAALRTPRKATAKKTVAKRVAR